MYVGGDPSHPNPVELSNAKAIGCGHYHVLVVAVVASNKSNSVESGVHVFSCGLNNYGIL
jgi:hypothetical protein